MGVNYRDENDKPYSGWKLAVAWSLLLTGIVAFSFLLAFGFELLAEDIRRGLQ